MQFRYFSDNSSCLRSIRLSPSEPIRLTIIVVGAGVAAVAQAIPKILREVIRYVEILNYVSTIGCNVHFQNNQAQIVLLYGVVSKFSSHLLLGCILILVLCHANVLHCREPLKIFCLEVI